MFRVMCARCRAEARIQTRGLLRMCGACGNNKGEEQIEMRAAIWHMKSPQGLP
jgi:hypothetical protein